MRLFSNIAEKAFTTASDGRSLFYPNGRWFRPYIIPNAETKQRLFTRQLWMTRLIFGWILIGQPIIFLFIPKLHNEQRWFWTYGAVWVAVICVVDRIVFRGELAKLDRD